MFVGAGGLDYGLHLAGFNILAAWETDPAARYTYHVNQCERTNTALYGDATDVDPKKLPDDIDLLAGGPPCQSFSTSQGTVDPDDPRHELAFSMVEWTEAINPKVVLIENVAGLTDRHSGVHQSITERLRRAGKGYQVKTLKLNAAEYGVPQDRVRVIVVAIRNDITPPNQWEPEHVSHEEPLQTLTGGTLEPFATAEEAIGDLPAPIPSEPPADDPIHTTIEEYLPNVGDRGRHRVDPHSLPEPITRNGTDVFVPPNHIAIDHSDDVKERKAALKLGASINETDRRLHPAKPAPTMTVSQGSPPFHYQGQSPRHPDRNVDSVRRLTPREVLRIQTFDDHYVLAGTKKEQYRQAADAVPPLLAHHLGSHIRQNILRHSFMEERADEAENDEEDAHDEDPRANTSTEDGQVDIVDISQSAD